MKYHIGCGKRDFGPDWIHIDGADFPHVTSKDVYLRSVPEGSANLIYASHFIEYFDRNEVKDLLLSWHRALKTGGELKIAVPDFETIARLYNEKEYELETFLGLLYGRMEGGSGLIYHKTTYDYKSLCRVLAAAGFVVMRHPLASPSHCGYINQFSPKDDHSRAVLPHMAADGTPVSLNVICYK